MNLVVIMQGLVAVMVDGMTELELQLQGLVAVMVGGMTELELQL